jgi:hypothetical protein
LYLIWKRIVTDTVSANTKYVTVSVSANKNYVTETVGGREGEEGREGGGKNRVGGEGSERVRERGMGNFPLASVGSWLAGQWRVGRSVGLKAQPTAGAP